MKHHDTFIHNYFPRELCGLTIKERKKKGPPWQEVHVRETTPVLKLHKPLKAGIGLLSNQRTGGLDTNSTFYWFKQWEYIHLLGHGQKILRFDQNQNTVSLWTRDLGKPKLQISRIAPPQINNPAFCCHWQNSNRILIEKKNSSRKNSYLEDGIFRENSKHTFRRPWYPLYSKCSLIKRGKIKLHWKN